MYDNYGVDVKWLYDPDNILDIKKKQEQEDWLDNIELQKIADIIDERIERVRITYADNGAGEATQAGEGVLDLLESLKENPEVGYPLFGAYVNSIFRGARLGKFYLRSAATGVGKTRSMIADACTIACDKRYDSKEEKWIDIGKGQPTAFIATEQDLSEVQTMMIAFLADVNEEHILNGDYYAGEWERVTRAAKILKDSPLYVEQLPDFSLQDIENTIKRNIREHGILYVFLDYIHTSMKILEEITRRSGGVRLREDNILFMMAIRLKDICVQYDVFIMSATQLNGDYTDTDNYDQNLLRGAKAIADKIDAGMIMLEVTANDIESLKTIINSGLPVPTVKISVYKNRRGRWKNIWLCCTEDRGTCKIMPVFVTKMNYELVDIQDTQIKFKGE
jgi:replicative DNA helicase